MSKQKHIRGKVIAKVGHLRIYQKHTNSEDAATKKMRTTSTDIAIYNTKTVIKGGFKSKASAVEAATKMYNDHLSGKPTK